MFCQDILPPRTRQLLLVLTLDMKQKRHSFSLSFGGGALEPGNASTGNIPELSHLGELQGLHLPQPMAAAPYGAPGSAAPGGAAPGNGSGNGATPGAPGGGGVDVAAALAAIARGGQS
jgi:hypothetical protein